MNQKPKVVRIADLLEHIQSWLEHGEHYIWNCTPLELMQALWNESDGEWIEYHQLGRIMSEAESTKMIRASHAGLRQFREWGRKNQIERPTEVE